MARQLLIILVFLFIGASSFAQFRYDESFGPKLKGKIDSVITPSGYGKTIGIFNKKGQLVEFYEYTFMQTEFNSQIHDTTRTVYEYDKKGLLSKSIRNNYTTNWNFVKEGDIYIAKFDHHRDDGSTYQEIFKLNSSFRLIEEIDSSNTYITSKFKTYDKNGYLIREHRMVKRPDNTLLTTDTYYTNDADGNVIVRATNGPIFKFTYTRYDKMHNWLERNNYKPDPEEIDEDYLMGTMERRITYYK